VLEEPIIWFDAPVGERLGRYYLGISVRDEDGSGLWWSRRDCRWYRSRDFPDHGGLSSHAPCATVRAFKRHLRKHEAELRGYIARLESRYVGHDVWGIVPGY